MDSRATSWRPEQLLEHVDWVRRLARQLVAEATAADDVAQQALLTALERPPPRAGDLRGWLKTVVRSVAGRLRRADESRSRHEAHVPVARGEAAAVDVVARANTQRAVVDALLALEEPYRATILLRYFEDLTAHEVAARLEVPVETVRTRLKRGVALLRGRLETKFGGERAWLAALLRVAELGAPDGSAVTSAAKAAAPLAAGATLVGTTVKFIVASAVVVGGAIVAWRELPGDHGSNRDAHLVAKTDRSGAEAAGSTLPDTAAPKSVAPDATREAMAPAPDAPAPVSAAPTLTLHGVVRDLNGAAVANAAVVIADSGSDAFKQACLCRWQEELRDARSTGSHPSPLRTLTKADGSYLFPEVPHDGTWNVAALHEKAGFAWNSEVEVESATLADSVDLVVEPGLVVSGTVTDAAGLPVSGAGVGITCVVKRIGDSGTWTTGVLSATTDAEGRYRAEPTPFRDTLVEASKPGYFHSGSISLRLAPDVREQVVDLKIEAGRLLSGRLLDRGGSDAGLAARALPELAVFGLRDDPKSTVGRPGHHEYDASIDAQHDRFDFAPLARDARFVAVYCRELLLGSAGIPPVSDGVDVALDFDRLPKPEPKGTLSIVAIDAATRAPIREFIVIFSMRHYGTSGRRASDAAGRFRSEAIPLGRYRVSVRADGYAIATLPIDVAEKDAATPTPFALVQGDSSISGVVFDADGSPLARAGVYLCEPGGEPALPWSDAHVDTDSKGRFSFGSLARGDYVLMAVEQTSFGEESRGLAPVSARVSLQGGAGSVDLRLVPGITVKLQPTGRGFASAFSFRIRDARGAFVVDCYRGGGFASQSGPGPFSFLVAPGSYTAEIHADHFKTGRADFIATDGVVVPVEMVRDEK